MRLIVLLLGGLALAGCKKDEPPAPVSDHQTDEAQEARARAREELLQQARDRADKLHSKVGELDQQLADAEAKLAAAKTDAERQAAEAHLRDLRAQQHASDPSKPPDTGHGKTIDLKCQDQPLGCK